MQSKTEKYNIKHSLFWKKRFKICARTDIKGGLGGKKIRVYSADFVLFFSDNNYARWYKI